MDTPKYQDLVAPFAVGYFTPIWFGNGTPPNNPSAQEIAGYGSIFAEYELLKGIWARVFENGFVVFDFGQCEATPIIIHRESLWNNVEPNDDGSRSDKKVGRRLQRTENRQRHNQSFYRSVLLAHILLLENAIHQMRGMGLSLPRIETIHDAYTYHNSRTVPHVRKEVLKYPVSEPNRDFLDKSFNDLKAVISGPDAYLRMLETHKLSHYRTLDQRFAESLVLSWTVCEYLLDLIWARMIKDTKQSDQKRMSVARAKKMKEPSMFTAAARIQTLELTGHLSIKRVNNLNKIRQARNKWLHEFKDVDERGSLDSIRTCADLISFVTEIQIYDRIVGGSGGEGGGMFIDRFQNTCPNIDFTNVYDGS